MRASDFFVEEAGEWRDGMDPWDTPPSVEHLDDALLEQLRRAAPPGSDDLSAATGLAELVHDEFEAYGTGGGQKLDDKQITAAVRALHATTRRLGLDFELPFESFRKFYSYWLKNDGHGSWQARRDMLDGFFDPLTAQLARVEEDLYSNLAQPVSPRSATGWPDVDNEVQELRRRFTTCTTPQDYRSLGTYCMGVIEAVSTVAYDPTRHVREGEEPLPVNKTKLRLDRIVEVALPGRPNEELRSLAKASVGAAHRVKHGSTPTRMEAGISADAVILMANIIRRLDLGEG